MYDVPLFGETLESTGFCLRVFPGAVFEAKSIRLGGGRAGLRAPEMQEFS